MQSSFAKHLNTQDAWVSVFENGMQKVKAAQAGPF